MSFSKWWTERYGRPPVREEMDLFEACTAAWEACQKDMDDFDEDVAAGESRIRVRSNRSGPTIVKFPFSEVRPSMSGDSGAAYNQCEEVLKELGAHKRDVALMNLCSRFGKL